MTSTEYDKLPKKIKSILDTFDFDKCSYKECTRTQNELEKNGYTCDSGLDGEINDIKKI